MSSDEPLTVSAERIAEHLRWRLSNANAELDTDDSYLDAAFDTGREGATVTLAVSLLNPETRQQGSQRFALTVTPLGEGKAT